MRISDEAAQHVLQIMRETWPYNQPTVIKEYATMTLPTINLRPTPWKFVRPDQGDDYFERTQTDGTKVQFDIQSGRKTTVKS